MSCFAFGDHPAVESAFRTPMISRLSGEVTFNDLRIGPYSRLPTLTAVRSHLFPVPGWSGHRFGKHHSDRGLFEVEAISNAERQVQIVLLAHSHPFYEAK